MFGVYWVYPLVIRGYCEVEGTVPTNTKHLYNIYTTAAQRLDVGPPLYKCYTNISGLLDWSGP